MWTNGCTDGRIHGQTFETDFIRSTLSNSPPKNRHKHHRHEQSIIAYSRVMLTTFTEVTCNLLVRALDSRYGREFDSKPLHC